MKLKKLAFLTTIFVVASVSALAKKEPIVVIKTSEGTIKLKLYNDTPIHRDNFIKLSKSKFFEGIIFHRVIKNFMIQSGDPTGTGAGGESIWKKPFEDEFVPNAVFDKPGILAMANRGPNTNGSQFFITTVPTYWLNGRHTIFGYVKDGMDIVRKIENVQTNGKYEGDKPLEDVKIISISIKE